MEPLESRENEELEPSVQGTGGKPLSVGQKIDVKQLERTTS